jgi:hypothetical protein
MGKWVGQFSEEVPKLKILEEMFNIICHERNAHQNYTESLSHLSQNGDH